MNSVPRMNSGSESGIRRTSGRPAMASELRQRGEPLVQQRVEHAADHRAPAEPTPPSTTMTSRVMVKSAERLRGTAPDCSSR